MTKGTLIGMSLNLYTCSFVERVIFKEDDSCITPKLSVNGRLFIAPREHLDALVSLRCSSSSAYWNAIYCKIHLLCYHWIKWILFIFLKICCQTPLPEQEGPVNGTGGTLELLSSKDIAYHLTLHDWLLFNSVHEVHIVAY